MSRSWVREEAPVWDAVKAAAFSPVGPEAHGLGTPADGEALGDSWWRVEEDGVAVGFGRFDDAWGDAEVLVVVAPEHRRSGAGTFAMRCLEDEAAARSVNYVYNVVPLGHPDAEGVTAWLVAQGFTDAGDGELRKKVTDGAVGAPSA